MKKLKKYLFAILIALLSITPALSGCALSSFLLSCGETVSKDLVFYDKSMAFSWSSISNASSYDIYLNDEKIDSVSSDDCIFQFGYLIDKTGEYNFKVEAVKTGMHFARKKVIQEGTYIPKTDTPSVGEYVELDVDKDLYVSQAEINGGVLYFKAQNITNFALGIYSNSLGYHTENIVPTYNSSTGQYVYSLATQNSLPKYEISAMRLLANIGDEYYIVSDILYYNPDNYTGYTDNIILFDGCVYDYYINTLDELQAIIYHSLVYRETDFNIKLSSEIYDMAKIFDGGNFAECLDLLIFQYGFGSFYETSAYIANNPVGQDLYFSKAISTKDKTYNIKISYLGIEECSNTIKPNSSKLKKQEDSIGYYDRLDYEMLDSTYSASTYDFASDNRFLYTEVSTTEQLYWAVENKVTPLPVEGSRAERIYNEAKETILSIVSDEMTDFEKTLSIFDWICINTVYDHTTYDESVYPTQCACYYLEGVFDNGVAVCDGFSKTFSLMCNMLGIDAIRVTGDADAGDGAGGHAWNKVLLDKDTTDNIPAQYYVVDITWTEIYSSSTNEILSHRYFLISDEDIKDTHFEHAYRDKFKKYIASSNFEYFNYMTFTSNNIEYDYVIDSDGDAEALFDYMFKNSINNMEVLFDIDFMIDKYEEIKGTKYSLKNDVEMATTSTGEVVYIYYQGLKSVFINSYLKETKFAEQYMFLVSSLSEMVYKTDGSKGFVYVITQNFLIDENGEALHLINALNQNKIYGTFDLYVENTILGKTANDSNVDLIERVNKLFQPYLTGTNINISFTFVEAYYKLDVSNGSTSYATHYKMTVTKK